LSCSGYFETLLRQVEEQSFNKQALQEIQQLKDRLTKKLQKLQVQGCFHEARQVQFDIDCLEKTEKSIKKLVEAEP